MATVKALLRNKLALEPPSAATLTHGQLLSPRALTSRQRCPTGTAMARATRNQVVRYGLIRPPRRQTKRA